MKVLARINFLWKIHKAELNKYTAYENTVKRMQNWL